jgi:hypothetical protein
MGRASTPSNAKVVMRLIMPIPIHLIVGGPAK